MFGSPNTSQINQRNQLLSIRVHCPFHCEHNANPHGYWANDLTHKLKGAVSHLVPGYSTAGVNFSSRMSPDEIYKNASTRPSLVERYILNYQSQISA